MTGWIGVDFDGTLATYEGWKGAGQLGEPVPAMVARVKRWLAEGRPVKVFTARCWPIANAVPDGDGWALLEVLPVESDVLRENQAIDACAAIVTWCERHIGKALPITCVKDFGMVELYDDRAVQVRPNTGELVGQSTRGL